VSRSSSRERWTPYVLRNSFHTLPASAGRFVTCCGARKALGDSERVLSNGLCLTGGYEREKDFLGCQMFSFAFGLRGFSLWLLPDNNRRVYCQYFFYIVIKAA
jgi:hypothetical protein